MIKYLVFIPIPTDGFIPIIPPTMQGFDALYKTEAGLVGVMEAEDLGHLEHLLLSTRWGSADWDECIVSVVVKMDKD